MIQGFPRETRLLTPSEFQRVFSNAIPAPSRYLTLLARLNNSNTPRLGLTVPKKKVKLAVQRNRIKRCVRESFRLITHELPNVDIIFIAKDGIADLSNKELYLLLEKQWIKLVQRCKH